ncbi:MAG TPA: hypothetical protein VMS79_04840 [Methanomassiliicoccales archaeon]|jgi:hypothetical protein|nr:hypothetical protein [Methanomassiliicoccales archaeon]
MPNACAPPAKVKGDVRKISNEKVLEETGRSWDEWFSVLDEVGVEEKGHSHAVEYLMSHHGLEAEWAEKVSLRYEEDRGLRSLTA